jgi:hypothetical protein
MESRRINSFQNFLFLNMNGKGNLKSIQNSASEYQAIDTPEGLRGARV